jgi:hypothetical protein
MSINIEADMLDITGRQRYLRSLARPGQPSLARLWVGHQLVRLGRWLEGRRPEEPLAPAPIGSLPRLAGGHR